MTADGAKVFLVDDDLQVREGLSRLLRSHGWQVDAYASAEEFLRQLPERAVGSVLLDIRMPGLTGTDLHDRLNACGSALSIIYLTAHSTVPVSVRAMKHGAYDFLEKPVDEAVLLAALEGATEQSMQRVASADRSADVHERLDALTSREREVMSQVIAGRMNKQIADDLGIALRTVKVHRSRMMSKMRVRSVAQLVSLCDGAGIRT
mgnify:CR=1 FL=1